MVLALNQGPTPFTLARMVLLWSTTLQQEAPSAHPANVAEFILEKADKTGTRGKHGKRIDWKTECGVAHLRREQC